MGVEEWDDDDRALAAQTLGTPDRAAACASIRDWLAELGHDGAEILSLELSIGAAVGIGLAGGARLFAKFWGPAVERAGLGAQLQVQDQMARRGFPAPALRSALLPFKGGCGVLMDFKSGAAADVRIAGVIETMAQGLARLVREGRDLSALPALPRHELPTALWPRPHNVLFDFEATAEGAEWIDAVARRARVKLRDGPQRRVLGHLDWSAKNMRMDGGAIAAVYDWDSVFTADETVVVGSAAASFPTSWELPVSPVPTPAQSKAFIAAYEAARGAAFTPQDRTHIRAACTYSQCYTARCDHALSPKVARERWAAVLGKPYA